MQARGLIKESETTVAEEIIAYDSAYVTRVAKPDVLEGGGSPLGGGSMFPVNEVNPQMFQLFFQPRP